MKLRLKLGTRFETISTEEDGGQTEQNAEWLWRITNDKYPFLNG